MHNQIMLAIEAAVNNRILGKSDKVRLAIITLLAEGHLLLTDVPGVGKTSLAKSLAQCLGLSFGRIQFTPDTLPGDVTGVSVYDSNQKAFRFLPGPVNNHIVLADEINRTSPKTQAGLLEVMAERQITVDQQKHKLEDPFMVIATQNPIEFLGTYHLPEAQLDRFLMCINLGYPQAEQELAIAQLALSGAMAEERLPEGYTIPSREELLACIAEVKQVSCHPDIINYVIELAQQTRSHPELQLGASTRAVISLLTACRAAAYMEGRDFVLPDDVQMLLPHVWPHRFVLSTEAGMKKTSAEQILTGIRRHVRVPVLHR